VSLGVALLGATGSIGRSTLRVLERHAGRFHLVAVSAHHNADRLAEVVSRHRPRLAVVVGEAGPNGVDAHGCTWRSGSEALLQAASHPEVDVVLNAIVGAAGLRATLVALESGKRLALANKESLVAGGPLVMEALRRGGGELIPVDSEHSAIIQCLRGARDGEVRRLILTASGGPFRDWDAEALADATREHALQHPTWDMGPKITVDSATLVNKALEVIEAHFLFSLPYDRIEAVVHPQSIIHSMVEFVDGSVVAQMGFPNMELPILYALTHPARIADERTTYDPVGAGPLTFQPVDTSRFRAFALGVQAGRAGGTAPAVFNAANEIAVEAFLAGNLPFAGIARVIEAALDAHRPSPVDSLDAVIAADRNARTHASAHLRATC
jgi:1-deoxy-D-xylulose-5-phosphate reductoisomerase